jgi:hypothetical protein
MKCIITDYGDSSVGLFPQEYEMDIPFQREDLDNDELEQCRNDIASFYSDYANGRISVLFDFEI